MTSEFKGNQVLDRLYALISDLPRCSAATSPALLPLNGIYFFFERGETLGAQNAGLDRIVRVGTHREDDRFRKRIRKHYGTVGRLGGNKNASVFRKHLGGALLRAQGPSDPRLAPWLKQGGDSYSEVEEEVSRVLRDSFTFTCVPVPDRHDRLLLESGLIALLAQFPACEPSSTWLGRYAAAPEIRTSGLWNTQHFSAEPLSLEQLGMIQRLVRKED